MNTAPFSLPAFPSLRKVVVADRLFARIRGLIGRDGLPEDTGMMIENCNSIHTFFMRFPIHAVFLGRDGEVVKIVRDIKPWTFCVWGGWRAKRTLELDARRHPST